MAKPAVKIKNLRAKLRFIVVGAVNTVIDFGIFNILWKLVGLPVLVSNTISTGCAMVFSFFANKKFTFKSTSTDYRREVILFFIFTIVGIWLIQNLVIKGILLILPAGWPVALSRNLAKILATLVSLIWNYITYDRIVFKKKSTEN